MAILETELYLQAGIALARAQLLERVIVNALVAIEILPKQREKPISADEWEKKYDDYVAKKYRSTLGPLIEGLKKVATVPPDLESILGDALMARNFLVHNFFRTHSESVLNPLSSESAIRELLKAQKLFRMAEERLVAFTFPIYERYAVIPELGQYLQQRRNGGVI